jgi:flagellar basal body-associated protein FliL
VEINRNKKSLSLFFLLGVIFGSISLAAFILIFVLYKKESKRERADKKDENKSLITNESSITEFEK